MNFNEIADLAVWPVMAFLFGATIGSFLNVVIYRIPLGMKVSHPKRSFCPICNKDIPWYRNIPLLTWLLQRGKCAECGASIAFRYFLVEALTGGLFVAAWMSLTAPVPAVFFLMALCVLLVVVSFIDAEHMIIPLKFVYAGMLIGIIGAIVAPALIFFSDSVPDAPSWFGGGQALLGLLVGWCGLGLVVIIGKYFFGDKKMQFEEKAESWKLREPTNDEEELRFVVGEEQIDWSEIFYRKKDRIEVDLQEVLLNGKTIKAEKLVVLSNRVILDAEEFMIADIESLEGKANKVVIPREVMGGGDPPLLGMLGAFFGWQAVIFILFLSSIYALIAALLGRVGFGRQLPFGPFLAISGLTWAFGGWKLWEMYLRYAGLL